jgi:hypothetical protein
MRQGRRRGCSSRGSPDGTSPCAALARCAWSRPRPTRRYSPMVRWWATAGTRGSSEVSTTHLPAGSSARVFAGRRRRLAARVPARTTACRRGRSPGSGAATSSRPDWLRADPRIPAHEGDADPRRHRGVAGRYADLAEQNQDTATLEGRFITGSPSWRCFDKTPLVTRWMGAIPPGARAVDHAPGLRRLAGHRGGGGEPAREDPDDWVPAVGPEVNRAIELGSRFELRGQGRGTLAIPARDRPRRGEQPTTATGIPCGAGRGTARNSTRGTPGPFAEDGFDTTFALAPELALRGDFGYTANTVTPKERGDDTLSISTHRAGLRRDGGDQPGRLRK